VAVAVGHPDELEPDHESFSAVGNLHAKLNWSVFKKKSTAFMPSDRMSTFKL
jgi:hypothetical protein